MIGSRPALGLPPVTTASRLIPPVLIVAGVVANVMQWDARLSFAGIAAILASIAYYFARHFGARFAAPQLRLSARGILAAAVWCGLLGGVLEAIARLVDIELLDAPLAMSLVDPYGFHLVPIGSLIVLSALGLIGMTIARLWRSAMPACAAVAVFLGAVLACTAPAWSFHPRLDALAGLALATGVGFQLARSIAHHPLRFRRVVRITLPIGLLVLAAAWVAPLVSQWTASRTALAAGAKPVPNVLLLVLDTVRADALSSYGYHRPTTPHLDQFAERGVRFERAMSASPWTLPGHASMFTGRLPHELFGTDSTPLDGGVALDDAHRTIAEVMRDRGYRTGGFIANTSFCSYLHGLDRGFAHYEDFPLSLDLVLHSSSWGRMIGAVVRLWNNELTMVGRKTAADVHQSFLSWLDAGGDERPFFAFLNYFDAHSPYMLPNPSEHRFSPIPAVPKFDFYADYSPAEIQLQRDAYDDCIAYLDARIGELIAALEARDVLSDTLVVITSDHGEQFGEHGLIYHGNSLYRPLLHVPLILVHPTSIPTGRVVSTTVGTRHLAATIADLTAAPAAGLAGASLRPHWEQLSASAPAEPGELLIGGGAPSWLPDSWPVRNGGIRSLSDRTHHASPNMTRKRCAKNIAKKR